MLETEIKKLTAAVNRLADLMDNASPVTTEEAITQEAATEEATTQDTTTEEADTPEVENEQSSGYTTDDIKSMALAISRKDRAKQKDIKAKLAEHDAKIATDLSGDALQSVGEWLSALKDELGV